MQGEASAICNVACHRCTELVATSINAHIDALVVQSTELAEELAQDFDVIELQEHEVSVTELVEDDLLLSIPFRVCERGESCENYLLKKANDQAEQKSPQERLRPFANLRDLLEG